ncbi:MAG: hypothetical protein KatS3mg080_1049 [Anoxybacillus sp.]|uniref:DUF2642 domain-containing protein n=1 Tax=Anoxybacillus gonensis TaxID=198467 RepID=UPI00214CC405|nr:DUF2642 domain-containing protein [Anoxybacillus gonensis]MCQ5365945.1 DUF2642 domain-containing protein [Anoxybacillus gonensis]GIW50438.1 MAG: hypothetical protein KatS3mg080_1049 [Anoxybacillus sp.]
MEKLKILLGKPIKLELSGKSTIQGILIDVGTDIIVIYNGREYLYIPHLHIQCVTIDADSIFDISTPIPNTPIDHDNNSISYRKILMNAKGVFVEIYVIGNKSIHGYVVNVLNDYFVFYSPVYKTMFISMNHLKWLIPYQTNITPYTLGNESLPVSPATLSLQRSFEEQLKKMEGKLVVLDLGDHPLKIGLLKQVQNNIIQLITAAGEDVYWKMNHVKVVYIP